MMKIPWFNRKKDEQGFIPIEVTTPNVDEPTQFEPASPTWRFVERWARENLEKLRSDNEKKLDQVQTAHIRGQIEFCRKLLNLPETVSRDTRLHSNRHQGILAGKRNDT